jgi:probable phosphoglycerate mutase
MTSLRPTDGVVAYIDGGARGNPGPAGYGVRIEQPDGTLVEEFGDSIGIATNNVAEYRALIAALEWARAHGHSQVHVRSDSLLLVQQMLGNYKVKNAGLQPLYARARLLALEIGRVTFEHVARARNAHADRLANAAMDEAAAVVSRQASLVSPSPVVNPPTSGSIRNPQSAIRNSADPLTSLERAVRLFVYDHFVKTTRAPDLDAIVRTVEGTSNAVASALRRLAELHALVLAPVSLDIWMAHPFSAVPTAYPVVIDNRTYWANCAWDAAGVLSLIGGDGETRTRCADCGELVAMAVRSGRIVGDGIVHYAVPPRRFWENVAFT